MLSLDQGCNHPSQHTDSLKCSSTASQSQLRKVLLPVIAVKENKVFHAFDETEVCVEIKKPTHLMLITKVIKIFILNLCYSD